jgi:hypothetical protein
MIYDLRFTIAASVHCVTREPVLSLAPGFSPVSSARAALSRFTGFYPHEIPLKRLGCFLRTHTGLKPGANGRVCR